MDENPAAAGPVSGWCVPTLTVSSEIPGVAAAGVLQAATVRPTRMADPAAAARRAGERVVPVGFRMGVTSLWARWDVTDGSSARSWTRGWVRVPRNARF